jgi:hypothetical protein
MAISRGYTFGSTELVTNTKLHTFLDSATISGESIASINLSEFVFYDNDIVSYDNEVVYYA